MASLDSDLSFAVDTYLMVSLGVIGWKASLGMKQHVHTYDWCKNSPWTVLLHRKHLQPIYFHQIYMGNTETYPSHRDNKRVL